MVGSGRARDATPDAAPDGRAETEVERADRNLNELLQELRVAQTGVQLLFGFLLTIPFAQRFSSITSVQKAVYVATLICSTAAMALLVAPVSYHRMVFRRRLKPQLVVAADRMAKAGLVFLLLAAVGAVFVVIEEIVSLPVGIAITAALAVLFVLLWYVVPLRDRAGRD